MKKTFLPALAAIAVLTACSTQQVGEFARALQTNGPAPAPQSAPKTVAPAVPAVSLASAGTLNQCRTEVSPQNNALLVTAGHNPQNRYFTCAVGSPMTFRRAEAGFNAKLIPFLCDMSKPVINTPVEEDMSIVVCTYPGPTRLPVVVDGIPIKAI